MEVRVSIGDKVVRQRLSPLDFSTSVNLPNGEETVEMELLRPSNDTLGELVRSIISASPSNRVAARQVGHFVLNQLLRPEANLILRRLSLRDITRTEVIRGEVHRFFERAADDLAPKPGEPIDLGREMSAAVLGVEVDKVQALLASTPGVGSDWVLLATKQHGISYDAVRGSPDQYDRWAAGKTERRQLHRVRQVFVRRAKRSRCDLSVLALRSIWACEEVVDAANAAIENALPEETPEHVKRAYKFFYRKGGQRGSPIADSFPGIIGYQPLLMTALRLSPSLCARLALVEFHCRWSGTELDEARDDVARRFIGAIRATRYLYEHVTTKDKELIARRRPQKRVASPEHFVETRRALERCDRQSDDEWEDCGESWVRDAEIDTGGLDDDLEEAAYGAPASVLRGREHFQRRGLTDKQTEVLSLVSRGLTKPEIAAKLGITRQGVDRRIARVGRGRLSRTHRSPPALGRLRARPPREEDDNDNPHRRHPDSRPPF